MQCLIRRRSGVYVFRMSVPISLRPTIGRREIILTTGTTHLAAAKLVAAALATTWRHRFLQCRDQLSILANCSMDPQDILRIAQGDPILLIRGNIPLLQAAAASGIDTNDLMRAAAQGQVGLFVRVDRQIGHLLPMESLEPVNPELGRKAGVVIPTTVMPAEAVRHTAVGILRIPSIAVPDLLTGLTETNGNTDLHLLALADQPSMAFLPSDPIRVSHQDIEIDTAEIESLRRTLANHIDPDQVTEAKALRRASSPTTVTKGGRREHELLSTALAAYIGNRVRHDVGLESEVTRIENGCHLLIELEGDIPLAKIDADLLRRFRGEKLSLVPANENKIRLKHGTTSVRSSIKAVTGTGWPVMSISERTKRMRWISAWFKWIHDQEWILSNPAAGLYGEHVTTKAERRRLKSSRRADEARDAFTDADLAKIFSAPWFQAGHGSITRNGTYRTFSPLHYWLPLLGLFTGGGRINELCQVHLDDIGVTASGTWYFDIHEETEDKNLKNAPSRRQVPLHPRMLTLGFDRWVAALRAAGYVRLFPELKRDSDKGYGKAATKWFSGFMAGLGMPRDGRKVFHSFRHTYTNALPEDTPDRIRKQLTGHKRGDDVHDTTYRKDVSPDATAPFVARLAVVLPEIAPFNIERGLRAIEDALQRKDRGRGADEDLGTVPFQGPRESPTVLS